MPPRITDERSKILNFYLTPKRVRETPEGARFRIGRIKADDGAKARDITHLLDRTYDYASPRELRWHLASRFGLPVDAVTVARQ